MVLKSTSNCLGFQQLTGMSTPTKLTMPSYIGNGVPTNLVVQVEIQPVRWRDDGIAPTATVGMLIPAGGELAYDGDLTALQLIQVTSGAVANVSFYN